MPSLMTLYSTSRNCQGAPSQAHVRMVLDILQAKKLYAKGSKCDFFRTEVQFLGFRVGDGQISKDPAKLEAVLNWPEPKTVWELLVRGFLRLA
eukprot:1577975-Rhodomonas_salina.2